MHYFPAQLNIANKKCLVVGSGSVASRKITQLHACGARIEVISPVFSRSFARFLKNKKINGKRKVFTTGDLEKVFLVIAATSSRKKNSDISRHARRLGILVNVVDDKGLSDIILPAYFRQGDLCIAVSTQGSSPSLARKIKQDIRKNYPKEYGEFLRLLLAYRKRIIGAIAPLSIRKELFNQMTSPACINLVKSKKLDVLKKKLRDLYQSYANRYARP